MKLPEEMPRELVGLIVDKVHDGAIEDITPIIETYDVIAEYFNNKPVDWRPINELPKKINESFIRIIAIDTKGETELYRYGTSESLRKLLIETYSHFAIVTPPNS